MPDILDRSVSLHRYSALITYVCVGVISALWRPQIHTERRGDNQPTGWSICQPNPNIFYTFITQVLSALLTCCKVEQTDAFLNSVAVNWSPLTGVYLWETQARAMTCAACSTCVCLPLLPPKIQPLLKMSQPLTISPSNSTNACSHSLLTFLLLFLSFSFPHFNTDFLLCCSTSCRETSPPPSGIQGTEHGEVGMKTTRNISCKFKEHFF